MNNKMKNTMTYLAVSEIALSVIDLTLDQRQEISYSEEALAWFYDRLDVQ